MKRPVLIVVAAVVLAVAIAGVAAYLNRPTFVSGDPWEYNLTVQDMPEGWVLSDSNIKTAYDMTQDGQTDLAGLQSLHAVQLSDRLALDVFDVTSQVLLYDSTDSAKAAFAKEAPGAEWEPLQASIKLGEAINVWHLKTADNAPQQATYRADVQYLNTVVSVTVTGSVDGMSNESVVLQYAAKVTDKLQRAPRPDALSKLGSQPDLRELLLSQDQLSRLDSYFGDLWLYNGVLQPGWTPNSAFENPAGMDALGRVMGYQAWFIKPLLDDEVKPDTAVGLFQQVTLFDSPEDAQAVLEKMNGLDTGPWTENPDIGDSAKAWTKITDSSGTSAGDGAVISTEISFRVGSYTGSIRVETPLITKDDEVLVARSANELLAYQFATGLASNLQNAGK
jgi:hypothetical protein